LNPLALVAIYSFIFGVVFGSQAPMGDPSGLTSYALYLLSGLLPWSFFGLVTGLGLSSLISNAGLVRKVAFARETLVFSQSIFSLVQFCIEMLLLSTILVIAGSPILPWLPEVIMLMLLLTVFSTGLALALAVFAAYFRDLVYLWTIIMQAYFFTTPIIYNADDHDAQKLINKTNARKLSIGIHEAADIKAKLTESLMELGCLRIFVGVPAENLHSFCSWSRKYSKDGAPRSRGVFLAYRMRRIEEGFVRPQI
jgi:hypothetical protein